jgi:hypothetical protein
MAMKLRQTFMLAATVALLAFLGPIQANAQGARQRPFSDWLDAQANVNPATCYSTTPAWLPPDFSVIALADYTGKIGACVQNLGGPAINTTVKGTVSERDLPDGTAEILVNVHFTNALAYAGEFGVGVTFGYYPGTELLGHPELKPGLANGHLQVQFIILYPGAPLDDLIFTDVTFIRFSATASGPLRAAFDVPEGTPGRFVVSQTGLFNTPGRGQGVADGYPAEIVRVYKAGK